MLLFSYDIYALKKKNSFDDGKYKIMIDHYVEMLDLIHLFISNHPSFLSYEKPFKELSIIQLQKLYADPVINEFLKCHPTNKQAVCSYWNVNTGSPISYQRSKKNYDIDSSQLKIGVEENVKHDPIKDLKCRLGILPPEQVDEAISIIRKEPYIRVNDLLVIEFLKANRDSWFRFE